MLENNFKLYSKSKFFKKIELRENFLENIEIKKCTIDGNYLVIKDIEVSIEIGSKYSEQRFINRLLKAIEFKPKTFYWFIGIPSIELINKILELLPKSSKLWVIEPFPEVFYHYMKVFSLDFLNSKNVELVVHDHSNNFAQRVHSWLSKQIPLYEDTKCLNFQTYDKYSEIDIKTWHKVIFEEIRQSCMMAEMFISTMDVSAKNYFLNHYKSLTHQDWTTTISLLSDKPLLIIGVGPSLLNEYENLRSLQKSVHIGVVDNGLRNLLNEGIEPDFVFQVDWQDDTKSFFTDLDIPKKTVLVTIGGANHKTINKWPGQLLFLPNPQMQSLSRDFIQGNIPSFFGTNVGMLAIQFGAIVRSNSVYLVGFDMGAPMMVYFHPKVIGLNPIYPSTSRFWSVEKFNYSFLSTFRESIKVKSKNDIDTYTAMSIEKGRKDLEFYFKKNKLEPIFIDTSKHGIGFENIKYKNLKSLVSEINLESHKDEVVLNQNCLDNEEYIKFLNLRHKDVRKYYELMSSLNFCGKDILKVYENDSKSNKLKLLFKDYLNLLDELHDTKTGWIEHLLTEIDRRLVILHESDNLEIEDSENSQQKMVGKVNQLVNQYKSIKKHEEWLKSYLVYLKNLNEQAIKDEKFRNN